MAGSPRRASPRRSEKKMEEVASTGMQWSNYLFMLAAFSAVVVFIVYAAQAGSDGTAAASFDADRAYQGAVLAFLACITGMMAYSHYKHH